MCTTKIKKNKKNLSSKFRVKYYTPCSNNTLFIFILARINCQLNYKPFYYEKLNIQFAKCRQTEVFIFPTVKERSAAQTIKT